MKNKLKEQKTLEVERNQEEIKVENKALKEIIAGYEQKAADLNHILSEELGESYE